MSTPTINAVPLSGETTYYDSVADLRKEMNDLEQHSKFVTERALTNADVANRRQWVVIIILIVSLILSNAGWIYYESQFQQVETTSIQQEVDQESEEGDNQFIGGDYYGTSESEN